MASPLALQDGIERFHVAAAATLGARGGMDLATGQVTAIDTANFRCDVKIGSDPVATKNLPYAFDLPLTVNDYVAVLVLSPMSYFVFATANVAVGAQPTPLFAEAQLSGDVTMTTANTWYDGPSVSLGPGRWLVIVTLAVTNQGFVTARIWDGTTTFISGEVPFSGNQTHTITLAWVITVTATATIRGAATSSSAAEKIQAQTSHAPQGNTASSIVAQRLN